MSQEFILHEKLAADCALVTDWPLSRVLLMNDATYPWLILVPRLPGLRDLDDLTPPSLQEVAREIQSLSKVMKEIFKPTKMNVAALGNMVPQLHIHVIARFEDDPAWPGPVWGVQPPESYEGEALEARVSSLRRALDSVVA
ncbi:MAG: HIT family protein [Limibacillus sp.]|jgi:diadenosine tetraphosphate (Ap4A) HIT family hydrolase